MKDQPEIIVITGASAGVGRATAREFAKRGAHTGLIARGRDGLEAARREVEEAGGRALVLPLASRTQAAAAEQRQNSVDHAEIGDFGHALQFLRRHFSDRRENTDHRVVNPHIDRPELALSSASPVRCRRSVIAFPRGHPGGSVSRSHGKGRRPQSYEATRRRLGHCRA
ncbi:MAG: SDR family NAD(P)-dependent oxidoreductase, partial [Chthoniobacterales bacterium]|nr:SDR family NAD(P)-dependent oxidoreductase [Chthoniobacterales bacterium]